MRRSSAPPHFPGYELLDLKPIGQGSRGSVYRARDLATDEIVAIKKFDRMAVFDDSMRQEVAKLIKAHSSVNGFVSIKKTAFDYDPPHYVMPFCKDGSLQKRLETGPMSVKDAVHLFMPIVRAMASIHQKGIIHGDFKPANILFNESGEPLISDFGLAQIGSVKDDAYGTLYYMPPEQARPENFRADLRWDVYAMGATLYQMLTQELPRRNTRLDNLLSHTSTSRVKADIYRDEIQKTTLTSLHQKNKNIDKHLSRIVDACLTIDPEKRPRDAGDLLERLQDRERWLKNRPFLTMMAVFTALVLLLAAASAVFVSQNIIEQTTDQVRTDTRQGLRDRAWIGRQLIREKIDDRVRVVTDLADIARKDPKLEEALRKIQLYYADSPPDEYFRPFTAQELELLAPLSEWLQKQHREVVQRRLTVNETKRMAFHVVVNGKSFLIGITNPANEVVNANDRQPLFQTNWSWRDYYGGQGNLFNERKDRHWPLNRTHISQAYVSKDDSNIKVDISTPVRYEKKEAKEKPDIKEVKEKSNVKETTEILAILVIGIDVKSDLTAWFDTDRQEAENSKGELLIINERGCPVFHPKAAKSAEDNKDPQPVYQSFEWFKKKQGEQITYDDPLLEANEDRTCWAYAQPVEFDSEYLPNYTWWVIAQVHQSAAEKPINDLRKKLRWVGIIVFLVVISLVIVLWIALIRILLRQTRDYHA